MDICILQANVVTLEFRAVQERKPKTTVTDQKLFQWDSRSPQRWGSRSLEDARKVLLSSLGSSGQFHTGTLSLS